MSCYENIVVHLSFGIAVFFTGMCGRHYYETHSDCCELIPYFRFDFNCSNHFQCRACRHRLSTDIKRLSKSPPEIDARNRGGCEFSKLLRPEVQASILRCTGDSGLGQSQPDRTGLRGGLTEGTLGPTPVRLWHQTLAGAKDSVGSQVKRP